jgi:D-aminoacyl-tRNA deacylase
MILIVASNKDVASLSIKEQMLKHYDFRETTEKFQGFPIFASAIKDKNIKLVTLECETVYAQDLTDFLGESELVVFISRHSSISGKPTLSVHTPGNLGEAELGGLPKRVSVSPANAMRDALKALWRFNEEMCLNYDVSYECTHHGPSLNVPTMFVELGSSHVQWKDLKAAEAVAHAVVETISKFRESKAVVALGIGGPHYNSKFTQIALQSEVAFGHIIPKYAIQHVDMEILMQCVAKTLEKVELALLDWKGIKGERKPKLLRMIGEINLPYKKV